MCQRGRLRDTLRIILYHATLGESAYVWWKLKMLLCDKSADFEVEEVVSHVTLSSKTSVISQKSNNPNCCKKDFGICEKQKSDPARVDSRDFEVLKYNFISGCSMLFLLHSILQQSLEKLLQLVPKILNLAVKVSQLLKSLESVIC